MGMVFVGPCPESITEMGQKHRARDLAVEADAPVVPGTGLLESESSALDAAQKLGFPVEINASIQRQILLTIIGYAESNWRWRRDGIASVQ